MNLVAVLMAGGRGERFWPLSRKSRPKQLLCLFDEADESSVAVSEKPQRTMLEIAVDRIRPLVVPDRILVVTAAQLVPAVRRLLPDIPESNLIGEPVGRNTASCIALAARIAEKRWGDDAVLLVKGADYRIGKPGRFRKIVEGAAEFAAPGDRIVTLGIAPERPDTGYGYIERRDKAMFKHGETTIYQVKRFHEKPDAETAERYCASDRFSWNSGMFLWTAATVRRDVERHAPEIARAMDEIESDLGTPRQPKALERVYPSLPNISIDYAVMEKVDHVYVAPADIDWDDVGSWTALERHHRKDENGNVVTVKHAGIDTFDCIVAGEGGVVATLGVKDLLIVRTDDVVLVADKSKDQEVKRLLALCRKDPKLNGFL
jgi:mannose-1-phosphate guanylyltransferase